MAATAFILLFKQVFSTRLKCFCIICVLLDEGAPAAEEVDPVLGLLLGVLDENLGHGLAEEKLPRLQFVVRADHNRRVHVEDHEVHDDDKENEHNRRDARVRLVHGRVGELAEEHLEAGQDGAPRRRERVVVLSKTHENNHHEHRKDQERDCCEDKNVAH